MSAKKENKGFLMSMAFAYAVAGVIVAVFWFTVKGFPSLADALPFIIILAFIVVAITVIGWLAWMTREEKN